jgi:hypothetical protein
MSITENLEDVQVPAKEESVERAVDRPLLQGQGPTREVKCHRAVRQRVRHDGAEAGRRVPRAGNHRWIPGRNRGK